MNSYPKIAIVYLSYHCEQYLDDAISAWTKLSYPKDSLEIVVVDNPHPEFGSSVRAIEEAVSVAQGDLPHVTILPQEKNLGFAGGNNAGARWAIEHGFDYIYFHNDDGFLAANAMGPLVGVMEQDAKIAIAESLILLYPDTEFINTSGNAYHYLGFGYCNNYRTPVKDLSMAEVEDIQYASGAGVLVRAELVKNKCWDEDFFLYHEDIEISFRLRALGYRVVCVPDSVFYHKYQFSRSIKKFYWMERNRFGVLLMFFKLPTLFLLLPMLIPMEFGLLLMSVLGGWWRERLQVYAYWLRPSSWKLWLGKRLAIQRERKVSDALLLKFSVPTIIFQESSMKNPVLLYVVNPVMKVYWYFIRFVVRW